MQKGNATRAIKILTNNMQNGILPLNTEEVRNSRVTKSNYGTELRKMTSHFELLARKFL